MSLNNFNISVEKKKKNILIPIVLVLIIIVIGIIGLVVSDKNDDGEVNGSVKEDNLNADFVNIYEEEREDLGKKEAELRLEEQKKKIEKVYEKFPDASWASKNDNEKVKLFVIYGNNVIYENGNIKEEIIFNFGTPKYIRTIISGGALSYFTVVTEEGKVYIADVGDTKTDLWLPNGSIDTNKLTFEEVKINGKVIDMAINMPQYVVNNSAPYYLTEEGELYSRNLKTFEEINRDHVYSISDITISVFVNKDTTIEVLRNYTSLEYIDVKDSSSNIIKSKYVVRANGNVFYVVDENDTIYTFSSNTVFVANNYAKEKKVDSIDYNSDESYVKITYTDGSKETIENVNQYVDVSEYVK